MVIVKCDNLINNLVNVWPKLFEGARAWHEPKLCSITITVYLQLQLFFKIFFILKYIKIIFFHQYRDTLTIKRTLRLKIEIQLLGYVLTCGLWSHVSVHLISLYHQKV